MGSFICTQNLVSLFNILLLTIRYILELDDAIELMMYKPGSEWVCRECGRSAVRRIDIARHVEARHVPNLRVSCQFCNRNFKTRDSLRKHVVNVHPQMLQVLLLLLPALSNFVRQRCYLQHVSWYLSYCDLTRARTMPSDCHEKVRIKLSSIHASTCSRERITCKIFRVSFQFCYKKLKHIKAVWTGQLF